MQNIAREDIKTFQQLKDQGYRSQDISRYQDLVSEYFQSLIDYDKAVESKDYDTQLDIEERIPVLEAEIRTFGQHPKSVPLMDLKLLAMQGHNGDPIIEKYSKRVSSPATGIRAFCVKCQGGSLAGIAECAAVNCPLYYFRMGDNPLFGRVLPPANYLEIEGDDVGDINEGEDAGDSI